VTDYGRLGRLSASVNPGKPTRRERAQATRSRILDAAYDLFVERGFTGTRMADIAERAGVAVQTVYFTFHTKAALLEACDARAVMGKDDPLPPEQQPFWRAMIEAPTGPVAVRHFVEGLAAIEMRVAKLKQVISAATHDPDARAILARSEELRRAGFREAVEHFATAYGLRDGLDIGRATDILLTVGDSSVYCSLVHDYGWEHEAFVEWLADAVSSMLLRPPG
jgi:AcrR family transcriptional regulator